MTIISLIILSVYILLIGIFIAGFLKTKELKFKNKPSINTFSILIPFRNEKQNLPSLLNSLSKLKYPKELFEILLINDESEDDFMSVINNYNYLNIRVLNTIRHSKSPKKDAIETGINHSKFNWILTTDADCALPKNWIHSFDEFIQKNDSVFIAGPVTFTTSNSFLGNFQLLDFTALIGCTIGGFGINKAFMCNGANLCYQKSIFLKLNGFEGNNTIASGDDIFLLEKMIEKYPKQIHYLKSFDALVTTSTETTLKSLISQRIRWASKTSFYTDTFTNFISLIVFLANIICAAIIIRLIFSQYISTFLITILILKFSIDFCIIFLTLKFLKKQMKIIYFPFVSIVHPFFNLWIGMRSILNSKYHWKNRNH